MNWCIIKLMNGSNKEITISSYFLTVDGKQVTKLLEGSYYYDNLHKCGCQLIKVLEAIEEEEEEQPRNLEEAMIYNGVSWSDFV